MNEGLTPELLTLDRLFHDPGAVYVVPIYQRNYAWQGDQIEILLQDIKDALDDGKKNYFLGNLVVTRRHETPARFEVIDGQQRLTTLYLLLSVLAKRDLITNDHVGCLQYESRPRATQALHRVAMETPQPSTTSSSEDAGILEAYNVISQFIETLRDDAARRQYADFMRGNVTVVRAGLPPKTDFNRYFEIMNTRGQQLQQADIVKAQLMEHLASESERACFAWIWDACSDMDSYVQMVLTRGNTTLRNAVFGSDWSFLTCRRFQDLVDHYHQTGFSEAAEIPTSTSLSLKDAIRKYATANVRADEDDQENERFRSIIEFPVFLLHVLRVVNEDTEEHDGQLDDKNLIKRFNAALKSQRDNKNQWVQNFAVKLLRCKNLFDSFVIKRQYTATTHSDEGDWSLLKLTKDGTEARPKPGYRNPFGRAATTTENGAPAGTLLMLQSMLRVTYTSPRAMHWISLLLKTLDNSRSHELTEAALTAHLQHYARSKVKEVFFRQGNSASDTEPTGFAIHRIVFTYLDYLYWVERRTQNELTDFRFSFRNSIEHFYPQNPDQQQTGSRVTEDWLHQLGNLALVSVGVNSKFSNSPPLAKAINFSDSIVQQSPKLQEMADITRRNNRWGDDEVEKHHQAVLQRLRNDIGLD